MIALQQLQNGAGTASMLPSASGATGEPLLLALVLLATAVFLAVCIAAKHDWQLTLAVCAM